MKIRSIPARALVLVAIGAGLLSVAACAPGDPATQLFVAKAQFEGNVIASRTAGGPSDAVLARLRNCESHGNYAAVSSSGSYRGAYQFSRQTWNNAARNFLPGYVGADPAATAPQIQDAMARVLWQSGGPSQWPVCGPRAG